MMSNKNPDKRAISAGHDQAARILLRPTVWRYRALISIAEICLRPVARFFSPSRANSPCQVGKILVFDPGGLGDIMLLLPFLQNLRACFPGSRVTLLGNTGAGAFLPECEAVDESIELRVPWRDASRWKRLNPISLCWLRFLRGAFRLRKEKFDLAFAAGWGGDFRGNLVIWLAGAARRIGYGYGGGGFLLTDIAQPDLAHPHVADRNLHLLDEIGFPGVRGTEAFRATPDEDQFAADLLAQAGVTGEDLVIGVHPGARSAVREWGDERFAEVARGAAERFGAKIFWFTDPARPRPLPEGLDAIPLALTFPQFRAVVPRCQLFLCNDSGPMHLATALNVPVVAVFGPQRPEWFGPYGQGHRVVLRQDIWCRPCADHCLFEQPYCLRLISVGEVTQAVSDVLTGLGQIQRYVEARG
jgi:heptosyltransferase-2